MTPDVGESGEAHDLLAVGKVVADGAGVAHAGHCDHYQVRLGLAKLLVADAQVVRDAGLEVLHDHVAYPDQVVNQLLAAGPPGVGDAAQLAAVQLLRLLGRRRARLLYLDVLRAKGGKVAGGDRPGHGPGQVCHADAAQGLEAGRGRGVARLADCLIAPGRYVLYLLKNLIGVLAQQRGGPSGLPGGRAHADGRAGGAVRADDGVLHLHEELPRLRPGDDAQSRRRSARGVTGMPMRWPRLNKLVALHRLRVLLDIGVDKLPVVSPDAPVQPHLVRENGVVHNLPGQPREMPIVIHGNVGVARRPRTGRC